MRPPGPARVDSAAPRGEALAACRDLVAGLPAELDGAARREVEPDDGTTAAWGDPAIVLRCGAAPPDPVTVQCVAVDGVDWAFLRRGEDAGEGHAGGHTGHGADAAGPAPFGFAFRTYGRDPVVEVVVPPEHAPEAEVLVPLAGHVAPVPRTGIECVGPSGG
ncbi:DUF3515 family protein [Vallicoccus soli]|uniref:DUF3515 family protein n=1 Tax=Vallicoccus soli TaxID=2339232 RepID=A0A3A3Z4W3_9ACTN|nr:DUF3515 family protein [Vallicoccus soli]